MPTSYTAQQNKAIEECRAHTRLDKSAATKLLKQHSWNLTAAVNAHHDSVGTAPPAATVSALNKIFDRFRDDPKNEPDEINVEGMSNLLGELSIGLEDVSALIFSEWVQSPSLGRIRREGFIEGCSSARAESTAQMKQVVEKRRSSLASDRDLFKKVYLHTFQLALQAGSKTLPLEMATEFWQLLFSPPSLDWTTSTTPWRDWWLEFLAKKGTKAVNKDLWKQTMFFALKSIEDDTLGFWTEESSWPSTIDGFVEWVKEEKRPGDVDAMSTD